VLKALAMIEQNTFSFVGLIITTVSLWGVLRPFGLANGPWEVFLDGYWESAGYGLHFGCNRFFRDFDCRYFAWI